jgi:hypothetical protein
MEAEMPRTASQGQAKSSTAVAGLGAALVACAITVAVASGSSPTAAPAQSAQPATNQCQYTPLMIQVSTVTGGGTIRFREGSYLSPPITLSNVPQTVVFPRPRSTTAQIDEVITIEGKATDVVTTFPVGHKQNVYPTVSGVLAFPVYWAPIKDC